MTIKSVDQEPPRGKRYKRTQPHFLQIAGMCEHEYSAANGANCTNYNMDQSAIIELKSYNSDFGVIVFAGKRINEKIAWRGPIVMNTWGEINLAYKELRNGNFYDKILCFRRFFIFYNKVNTNFY